MPDAARILVVENEFSVCQILHILLSAHGYEVLECETGETGIQLAAMQHPDLMLLNLAVPDMDGLRVIHQVREWSHMPILALSVQSETEAKVAALDAGADDYVLKPFGVDELLARIRVALRHAAQSGSSHETPVFVSGALSIDLIRRQVFIDNQEIHLSPIEYRLLKVLAQNVGTVTTHQQLLNEIWGSDHAGDVHYLHIYIRQLRHKLEASGAQPCYVLTEPKVGYRLAMLSGETRVT